MKRPFYKTIRGRVILTMLSMILILGIAISSASYIIFQRNLNQTMVQSTETNLQLLAENINDNLNNVIKFLTFCQYNDQIADFLLTSRGAENYSRVTSLATDVMNTDYLTNPSKNYIQRFVVAGLDRTDFLQIVSANYSVDKPLPQLIQNLPYYKEYMAISGFDEFPFQVV